MDFYPYRQGRERKAAVKLTGRYSDCISDGQKMGYSGSCGTRGTQMIAGRPEAFAPSWRLINPSKNSGSSRS